MSKDMVESLGIHPVMLYRWQMEQRIGKLERERENRNDGQVILPAPERQPIGSVMQW